jgi:hypothetical protein
MMFRISAKMSASACDEPGSAYSALPAADPAPSMSFLALKSDVRTCTATFVTAFMLGEHLNKGIDQKLARGWRIPVTATTNDLAAPVMRPIGPIS